MNRISILNRIRIRNLKNLLFPTILLILIIVFYIKSPMYDILRPAYPDTLSGVEGIYKQDIHYIDLTVDTLYDTGLECIRNGRLVGKYYYTFSSEQCYFFLISKEHYTKYLKEASGPDISNIRIRAKVIKNAPALREIMEHLSRELSWTYNGMNSSTSKYLISEPDYHYSKACIILTILLIPTATSCFYIIYSLLCICCPYLYKSLIKLRHYGKISKQTAQAEKELREKILFKEGSFIITANYLYDCSRNDLQIIPLEQIVWAYKFSSYHPTRYRNHKITYTLCIYGKHKVLLMSPYHIKTDADKVLDYLSMNYPNVLFGYSKEHEKSAKLLSKTN